MWGVWETLIEANDNSTIDFFIVFGTRHGNVCLMGLYHSRLDSKGVYYTSWKGWPHHVHLQPFDKFCRPCGNVSCNHMHILLCMQLNDVCDLQYQDICLREGDCERSRSRIDQPLTYISYIGISVSIVCLVFTLLTLLIFKYVATIRIKIIHHI